MNTYAVIREGHVVEVVPAVNHADAMAKRTEEGDLYIKCGDSTTMERVWDAAEKPELN